MTGTRRLLTPRRSAAAALLALCAALICWGWVPDAAASPGCRTPANGAWIGVEWTSQPLDPQAVAALARQASAQQLRYLFAFTTYVKADGSLSPSYSYARPFVATFRQHNQQTAILAWIGLPSQHLALTDPQARAGLIAAIAALVSVAEFDGVHINAEPIASGDPAYLQFLDELRSALGPTPVLSVASLPWMSELESWITPANPYRWSTSYYQAVAQRADQVVTMTYDSQMIAPGLYRAWMREQVRAIRRSIAGQPAELLIGI